MDYVMTVRLPYLRQISSKTKTAFGLTKATNLGLYHTTQIPEKVIWRVSPLNKVLDMFDMPKEEFLRLYLTVSGSLSDEAFSKNLKYFYTTYRKFGEHITKIMLATNREEQLVRRIIGPLVKVILEEEERLRKEAETKGYKYLADGNGWLYFSTNSGSEYAQIERMERC